MVSSRKCILHWHWAFKLLLVLTGTHLVTHNSSVLPASPLENQSQSVPDQSGRNDDITHVPNPIPAASPRNFGLPEGFVGLLMPLAAMSARNKSFLDRCQMQTLP
ncbi:hypothetical protein QQF64_011699 [Cirrhinus molitorella]|uniref:Uncharacterized protein n=1 Tax=Cirrhinus molitorella TaxID=172907 RepID=A0ABR3M003_9TELE